MFGSVFSLDRIDACGGKSGDNTTVCSNIELSWWAQSIHCVMNPKPCTPLVSPPLQGVNSISTSATPSSALVLPQSWHFLNLKGTFFTDAGQQQATQG